MEAGATGKAGPPEKKGHSRSRSWVAAVTAPFSRSASGVMKPAEEVRPALSCGCSLKATRQTCSVPCILRVLQQHMSFEIFLGLRNGSLLIQLVLLCEY